MGFLNRIAKSFLGKKELEVEKPQESSIYGSTRLFTPPSATSVAPGEPNGLHHAPPELQSVGAELESVGGVAVAVVEPQDAIDSAGTPELSATEELGADFFGEDFEQAFDDAFDSLVSQDASAQEQNASPEMFADDQIV